MARARLDPSHAAAISTLADYAEYAAQRSGAPDDVHQAIATARSLLQAAEPAQSEEGDATIASATGRRWDRRSTGPAASDGTRALRPPSDQALQDAPTAVAESIYGGNETGLPPARVLILREDDRFVPAYDFVLLPDRTVTRLAPAASAEDAVRSLRTWWERFGILGSAARASLVERLLPHVQRAGGSADAARLDIVEALRQPGTMRSAVYLALVAVRREFDRGDAGARAGSPAERADLDHVIASAPWIIHPVHGCMRRERAAELDQAAPDANGGPGGNSLRS